MPALAFRRRRDQRRWRRQPKKFVWTLVGPQTYVETGSGISGYIGSGKDEWTLNKTGKGIANAFIGSGGDAFTTQETATGISGHIGSGGDAFTTVETGKGVNNFIGSGADVATFAETGTGIANFVGSGGDATTYVEAGTAILTGVGSGSAVKISLSLLLRNVVPFVTRTRRRT